MKYSDKTVILIWLITRWFAFLLSFHVVFYLPIKLQIFRFVLFPFALCLMCCVSFVPNSISRFFFFSLYFLIFSFFFFFFLILLCIFVLVDFVLSCYFLYIVLRNKAASKKLNESGFLISRVWHFPSDPSENKRKWESSIASKLSIISVLNLGFSCFVILYGNVGVYPIWDRGLC